MSLTFTFIYMYTHTHTHTLGPSLQEDITASGPSVNTTLVISGGQQQGSGITIALALNLTDDEDTLEAIEMYQLTLTIPEATRGVVSGEPIVTTINILDDDGMCCTQ